MARNEFRIGRKQAQTMDELISEYIRNMKLEYGLNNQRVFAAWDQVSGASGYTIKRFFRDGILHISLSSSVVRNQLYFQREAIVREMNKVLEQDSLFTKEKGFVKNIVLK